MEFSLDVTNGEGLLREPPRECSSNSALADDSVELIECARSTRMSCAGGSTRVSVVAISDLLHVTLRHMSDRIIVGEY